MSRTQVRIILILIALILVLAAILSGILTYWVGAEGVPIATPEPGKTGRHQERAWQPEASDLLWLQSPYSGG